MVQARVRQAVHSDLMPVALFAACVIFAAASVPAARSGSAVLAVAAIGGVVTAVVCLAGWVMHADKLAIAREARADPVHLSNWWSDFERQFWRHIEGPVEDDRP